MKKHIRRLVSEHLEGALSREDAARLRQAMADPEVRAEVSRLETLDDLLRGLGERPAPAPSPDLAQRALARAATRPAPRSGPFRRLQGWLTANPLRLGGALAASAVAGLVLGLLVAGGPRPADGEVMVHFALRAPQADSVSLVGTFNGWEVDATPMERVGDDWRVTLPLPKGRYEYQFVIDGKRWVVDPAAPRLVADGFGGRNGVIEV